MDSLTQIVLGAACAEATSGKKIGNKALLYGAIGGTIPDLDVFIGNWIYGNKIDAMLFHRGFMHSLIFAVLASFIIGWLTHKGYEGGKKNQLIKSVFSFFEKFIRTKFLFRMYDRYRNETVTTQKNWIWLFLLAIGTHPILDCFTGYGTQLFLPFSEYRVAFSNISVADPTYTVPFLL
jgi:inner membrane protein